MLFNFPENYIAAIYKCDFIIARARVHGPEFRFARRCFAFGVCVPSRINQRTDSSQFAHSLVCRNEPAMVRASRARD